MKNKGMYIRLPKARGEWAELRFMIAATELGFRVSKPWGESGPYDLITDHRGHFYRIQVKCTLYMRDHSYVCTISSRHHPYRPSQLDFIAAYVIPTNTWYILPLKATKGQKDLVLSPHLKNSKYKKYEESGHLLKR